MIYGGLLFDFEFVGGGLFVSFLECGWWGLICLVLLCGLVVIGCICYLLAVLEIVGLGVEVVCLLLLLFCLFACVLLICFVMF